MILKSYFNKKKGGFAFMQISNNDIFIEDSLFLNNYADAVNF